MTSINAAWLIDVTRLVIEFCGTSSESRHPDVRWKTSPFYWSLLAGTLLQVPLTGLPYCPHLTVPPYWPLLLPLLTVPLTASPYDPLPLLAPSHSLVPHLLVLCPSPTGFLSLIPYLLCLLSLYIGRV